MLRTVFAMAIAGLVLAAVPGATQAAPIARSLRSRWASWPDMVTSSTLGGVDVGEIAGGADIAVGVGETAGASPLSVISAS